MAIDGDTIVAGAFLDNVQGGGNEYQGSVYTFARTGAATRTETAKLTASDSATDDRLGHSVAIDGDTIVAGAPSDDVATNTDQGSVYTFASTDPTGAPAQNETVKLTASDGAAFDFLGISVAVDGDTIVAGAFGDDMGTNTDQGSAYTFASTDPTGAPARNETAKLTASDGAVGDEFGFAVAVDGETIVAGAALDDIGANTAQGSAYTFASTDPTGATARTETAKLTASDGAAFDYLGASVAVDGETIVTGAPYDDIGANPDQGSASVFFAPADTAGPTVTIDQAAGQADPTSAAPVNFTVVFSEPVTGFDAADVVLGGTAGGTLAATVTGSGTTYNVAVTGMTTSGTVTATVAAGATSDAAANPSVASTSTDNVVSFTVVPPSPITLDIAGAATGNGHLTQVGVGVQCPAGDLLNLGVVLTQGSANGSGSLRTNCTGTPQYLIVNVRTSTGPALRRRPRPGVRHRRDGQPAQPHGQRHQHGL
ncbi:MAG: Ig-like domain-containing protein [Acidimicrobiales bacterium]